VKDIDRPEPIFDTIKESKMAYSFGMGSHIKPRIGNTRHNGKGNRDDVDINDSVGVYFHQAASIPLLTADQEVELAERFEHGCKARAKLADGHVSPRRRTELQSLVQDGWAAYEHLVVANSRLVISVAKKYRGRGVPFLDLIQEGNIGLIRAVKKFDYRRGCRFSTFATWWIRQSITRAIADQGRTIRLPVHTGDRINKMNRLSRHLAQELGREPTIDELANAMEITAEKVDYLIQIGHPALSLGTPVKGMEGVELGDFIQDTDELTIEEAASKSLMHEYIRDLLKTLPPREALVLRMRFGFVDGMSHTLAEVGQRMGITRERVRQIEEQALGRLRFEDRIRTLKDYLRG
jgi:RNA polymerase primary sigma factor